MSPFSWDGRVPRYPADRASRYRDAGLWSPLPTAERFHQSAVAFPDREAVVDTRGRLSYAELDRRTDQIAAALHALGIRAHDPVIFQVTNRIECALM
jgi:2,3-dihydroxybenzoate-AMP ligase